MPRRAIPTFHCLGLYWSPPGGSADKEVLVRYRPQGVPAWKPALSMRHNPIPGTDEDLADYRGSIVHLAPATTYEVELTLAGTTTTADLTATTWSEDFPAGETVRAGDRDTPLAITRVGHAGRLARLRRPGRDHRRAPQARPVHHDRRLLRDPPRLHAQGGRRRRRGPQEADRRHPDRRRPRHRHRGLRHLRLGPARSRDRLRVRLWTRPSTPAAPSWNASSSSAASCTIRPGTAAPGTSRNIPRTRRGRRPSPCSTRRATT